MNPKKVKFYYVDASSAVEIIKDGDNAELSMWHDLPPGDVDYKEISENDYGKKTIKISIDEFNKIWEHFKRFDFKKYSKVKKLKFGPPPCDGNSSSVLTLIVDGKKIVDWDKPDRILDSKQAEPLSELVQIPIGIYNKKYIAQQKQ